MSIPGLNLIGLTQLAITEGAATPNPGAPGWAWSTTLSRPMYWNGTIWTSAAPLASPTFTGTPTAPTATAGNNTTQLATTAFVVDAGKRIPMTTQNGAYTLVAGDAGRGIKKTDTTARSWTINTGVHAADDVVTCANYAASANVTLVQGSGVTMYLAGTSTTGNRTIAPRGLATVVFESSTVCYVSGPGVT